MTPYGNSQEWAIIRRERCRVFAFNKRDVLIETNVRTAYLQHFFADAKSVHDKELLPLILAAAEGEDAERVALGTHGLRDTFEKERREAQYQKCALYAAVSF
jgi:hypothetical protein